MAIQISIHWGCVCKPGKPCAYHAKLARVEEGCRLGGISLEQRLAVVEYSGIPALQREAAIIKAGLHEKAAARRASQHREG